jgi:hypothetical protein
MMNLKNVENSSELFVTAGKGMGRLCDLTEAIVWAARILDLDAITVKNVDEWLFRAALMNQIGHAVIVRGSEKAAFTRAEIVRHIGITMSVVTLRTRKQFLSNLMECLERDVERTVLGKVLEGAIP